MFTGIIESTARVRSIGSHDMWVDVPIANELELGQSVACSGVCLTVVENDQKGFRVELMDETMKKTYLGELKSGDLVNIERAMLANGRFDGHVVQGHCDGVAVITDLRGYTDFTDFTDKNSGIIELKLPNGLSKYIVQKGSVCLDGISLTVISVDNDLVKVGIIPHTWEVTNLHTKKGGDKMHVEVDVMAKYIEKLVSSK